MHMLRKGKSISYSRAREIFASKLSSLGLDCSKYGLHSYRSGGATTAANNGVSDRLIQKHGRWRSDVFKDRYIHVHFVYEELEKCSSRKLQGLEF